MTELADVEGSNPSEKSCGFESHYRRLASILYKYTPAELQRNII